MSNPDFTKKLGATVKKRNLLKWLAFRKYEKALLTHSSIPSIQVIIIHYK